MRRNHSLPFPDRRRHRRILTLRNFGWFSLAAVVLFAAISIRSEMRGRNMRDYGRIVAKQVPDDVKAQPREIVTEAPVPEETHADPMLLSGAAREQYLGVDERPVAFEPTVAAAIAPPTVTARDGRVAIVGDANGVAVVQEQRRRPTLSGGIFKPQP